MKPLRIVLVMPQAPLPFGGAAARWHYVLLRGLVARGHRVTAFASCGAEDVEACRSLFDADHGLRLFRREPLSGLRPRLAAMGRPGSYLFSPAFRESLARDLLSGVDVLHLEELWSGWVGIGAKCRTVLNIHSLYALDLRTPGARSLTAWRLAHAERRILRRYSTLTALTPRLTEQVRRVNPSARVTTVPLGLALDSYTFVPPFRRACPTVGLIGSFSWAPTFSAAIRLMDCLWPSIRRQVPNAKLQLVGREANRLLAGRAAVSDVSVHDTVPDIVPFFRDLDVLVYAPTDASGVKIKVLEAMAFGVPVVSNAEGIEGIPAEDGVHLGLAEDDAGLVERTVRLLLDVGERTRLASAARRLVEERCSEEIALDATEAHYRTQMAPDRLPV